MREGLSNGPKTRPDAVRKPSKGGKWITGVDYHYILKTSYLEVPLLLRLFLLLRAHPMWDVA